MQNTMTSMSSQNNTESRHKINTKFYMILHLSPAFLIMTVAVPSLDNIECRIIPRYFTDEDDLTTSPLDLTENKSTFFSLP